MRCAMVLAVILCGVCPAARAADPVSPIAAEPRWQSLFDGRTLGEWKQTPFGAEGEPLVADGVIRIPMGGDLSGITWAGDFPRRDYEIALEARRVEGNDFFCGLTFPVGDDSCSLILGGWGGAITGLSSIDGRDAGDNETTDARVFEKGRWYAVKVRVTEERIECFLDGESIIDQATEGRRISVRDEVIPSKPLGIATYATTAEVRGLRWRPVAADAESP
ncbi:MAG: DUF1080 domain-containing protein [Planctomycetia bacterium]|nr:DUF1080 domain-containing protein [Planctomycetia bacterium]